MKKKNRYIELFAGCGGLSLGLESCDWQLELANELSPMAAETFAYNLLGHDISAKNSKKSPVCQTKDISSLNIKEWNEKKLAVGDVVELVEAIENDSKLRKRFQNLDLISGGPPCQGFSMAGKRRERDPKNKLPYAFVDLVKHLQPKTVVLENVEGILRPFKSYGGKKSPWLEIAKAFALIGYAPICFLVNAKHFGIPQNRPRFILLGIRQDFESKILAKLENTQAVHAMSKYKFGFELAKQDEDFIINYSGFENGIELEVLDMSAHGNKDSLKKMFNLSNLYPEVHPDNVKTVNDGIHDLKANGGFAKRNAPYVLSKTRGTKYSKELSKLLAIQIEYPQGFALGVYNHELRKHSMNTQLRFFLIQEATKHKNGERKALENAIRSKGDSESAALKLWPLIKGKDVSKKFGITSAKQLANKIESVLSKKHIQRSLKNNLPAPAQVTIPDDLCHYAKDQQRVLSVREMARLQSFPDEFVFRSKVTTGGQNRETEVPQYTQVGNAVPPLLGRSIGLLLNEILDE